MALSRVHASTRADSSVYLLLIELQAKRAQCCGNDWTLSHSPGSYSRKQVVRTIEQRSCDLRRRYDTTYSQNMSQAVIVS